MRKHLSFFADVRMPWFLPAQIIKRQLSKYENTHKNEEVKFVFTVDFEQDYGSAAVDSDSPKNEKMSVAGVNKFIKLFSKLPKKIGGDVFVQANIAEKFKDELREIQKNGFELGLHGYEHELWGKPMWFLKDKFISITERERRLCKSIEIFEKCGFGSPKTFRAPNMIIDDDSIELLSKYDFEIDSSLPSYLGVPPLVRELFVGDEKKLLKEIPVSCDPYAEINFRMGLPFSNFRVLNFHNLIHLNNEGLIKMLQRILAFQKAKKHTLHLVFLCHPWEFTGSLKMEILLNKLQILEKEFKIKYVKLRDL